MKRVLTIALLVMAAVISAATPFRTLRLQRIASALCLTLPDTLPALSTLDSVVVFHNHAVHARTDVLGHISHIGYDMFSPEVLKSYKCHQLLEFLERYLLELDLNISTLSYKERMDVDRVTVISGKIPILANVTPTTDIAIQIEERTRQMYRLTFTIEGNEVRLTIPADCQLLLGADAIELEQIATRDIPMMSTIADSIQGWGNTVADKADSIIVEHSAYYMIDRIRSDIHLAVNDGQKQVLCSPSHPTKSVSNIMLTGIAPITIPMTLAVNKYGGRTDSIQTTVQQYINFCIADGCRLFFGIKDVNQETLSGTLFAYNESIAFTHMLKIDFPLDIIHGQCAQALATAYVYIPMRYFSDAYFKKDFYEQKKE